MGKTSDKQLLLNYFLNDNKSGYKTRVGHFQKIDPVHYQEFISYVNNNQLTSLGYIEQLHCYLHDITPPVCKQCGGPVKYGRSLSETYRNFCSMSCTNKHPERIESIKKTNVEKYGTACALFGSDALKKTTATLLDRYGVDNIFKDKDKVKKAVLAKYGVDHPMQSSVVKKNQAGRYVVKYAEEKIFKSWYIGYFCEVCQGCSMLDYNKFHSRKDGKYLCLTCYPLYESIIEKSLRKHLTDLNIKVSLHNRRVIKPQELDFYVEEKRLGIELNGNYFHSEVFVDANYHLNKLKSCENNKVELLQFFEDELHFKKEIVYSMITHKLGLSARKIFGRKCELVLVKPKEEKEFVERNHILGYTASVVCVGLQYENSLVALMSFGGLRKNLGNSKKEGCFEMIRFCSLINTNVIGAANKLLKYFIDNYTPTEIITYANRRYSRGDVYKKLGFEYVGETQPNYYYIKSNDLKRYNRFNFTKHKLVKEGYPADKTEKQIMLERKIYRLYDCGNSKFVLKIDK